MRRHLGGYDWPLIFMIGGTLVSLFGLGFGAGVLVAKLTGTCP